MEFVTAKLGTMELKAHIDAKDGSNSNKLVYEKDGDISSKVLDSVEVADESVDKKEDPDVGKNGDRPIVQEHEDSSRMIESNDKKEDPDDSEDEDSEYEDSQDEDSQDEDSQDEDRPQEPEDSSPTVVGREFIKEVQVHYCELCDLCLCNNEKMMAHIRTPLHLHLSTLMKGIKKATGPTK